MSGRGRREAGANKALVPDHAWPPWACVPLPLLLYRASSGQPLELHLWSVFTAEQQLQQGLRIASRRLHRRCSAFILQVIWTLTGIRVFCRLQPVASAADLHLLQNPLQHNRCSESPAGNHAVNCLQRNRCRCVAPKNQEQITCPSLQPRSVGCLLASWPESTTPASSRCKQPPHRAGHDARLLCSRTGTNTGRVVRRAGADPGSTRLRREASSPCQVERLSPLSHSLC